MKPNKLVPTVTLSLPKMKTKRVWIGSYFNHYNGLVIFFKKPLHDGGENVHISGEWIDLMSDHNKKIIAGACGLWEFRQWFPGVNLDAIIDKKTDNAKQLEPQDLVEINLTAFWDGNKLMGLDFDLDGYQS